ncbi:MAG TPA: 2-oxoglutarate dehydrogenase complex dihydrolipoyllysine-residue succinyltransferase [Syntrophobacteria bacterium]|nr:2-oxoglutarate dehydrogenase complex dihydrolipoyllysine-residue succinyltransferase [Syntrophobacteria bacterium]
MKLEVKVPSVGESVREAVLAQWYKRDGDRVRRDEPLFVIETDKVTLEVTAEADGILTILVKAGATVPVGAAVGEIDTEALPKEAAEAPPSREVPPAPKPRIPPTPVEPPRPGPMVPPPAEAEPARILSPAVRRLVAAKGLDVSAITGTGPGDRITKGDVLLHLEQAEAAPRELRPAPAPAVTGGPPVCVPGPPEESVTRKPMTQIRRRIAERLVGAKQSTAMLTTFNEIDMSRVQDIRARFQDPFQKKYEIRLGIMSFFIKATIEALKEFPEINASIEGTDILYHNYYHLGVAIGAERGLVVPVIRHADKLSFAELERAIVDYVNKIKENRLALSDLEGGTFTITNGGVYGSLLSTPILNMPQSGILGMHKIEPRPVVVDGQVLVRPMMYVALSYDHRIVDGRQAVTFLVRIKEFIEDPDRIMVEI